MDDLRVHRHEDRIDPRGARADGDERVHRGAAVAPRAPGGPVEAAAGPELDERRGPQDQLVQVRHGDRRLGREHRDHDQDGRPDGHGGLQERLALVSLALHVVGGDLVGEGGRGARRAGGRGDLGPYFVPRRQHRCHGLIPPGDRRVEADGGSLRGEVDGCVLDARCLLQESLDPVDTRGAGHPLDREDDLDRQEARICGRRRRGWRRGGHRGPLAGACPGGHRFGYSMGVYSLVVEWGTPNPSTAACATIRPA